MQVDLAPLSGKNLCLAVSGGVDSMAMLHFFASRKNADRLKLSVCHVNHNLRETSAADAALVRSFCESLDIPYYHESVDVRAEMKEHRSSLEMAAHACRKAALQSAASAAGAELICTAHHRGDQIETIFMRLGMGTGRQGLNGLAKERGGFYKPFLELEKSDILAYAEKHAIPFNEDESNTDLTITRNAWRHAILPQIEAQFGAGYFRGVLATANNLNWLEEDEQNLSRELAKLELSAPLVSIELNRVQSYFSAFLKRFVEEILRRAFVQKILLNRDEFKQLCWLVHHAETGKQLSLFGGVQITRNANSISLEQIEAENEEIRVALEDGETRFRSGTLRLSRASSLEKTEQNTVEFADAEKFAEPLVLRRVARGDRFCPIGLGGEQTVNRFLKNAKVEHAARKHEYVLTSAGNIVWLLGHRLDDRFKVVNKTTQMIKMEWLND